MSTEEADKLLAEGDNIRLADRTYLPLRYGYRELYLLEKQFGNVQVVFDALQAGFKGEMFGALLPALAIGAGIELEELFDKLDSKDMTQHTGAFGRSFQQAFPQPTQEMADPESETTGTVTASPGLTPGISQPDVTEEMKPPSGA